MGWKRGRGGAVVAFRFVMETRFTRPKEIGSVIPSCPRWPSSGVRQTQLRNSDCWSGNCGVARGVFGSFSRWNRLDRK